MFNIQCSMFYNLQTVKQEKLLSRLRQIPESAIRAKNNDGNTCRVEWEGGENGLGGGHVEFSLVDIPSVKPWLTATKEPNFIISSLEVETLHVVRNPMESAAAALMMIATLNQAAAEIPAGIPHVARANNYSKHIMEQLKEWGIYSYCDIRGKPLSRPVLWMDIYTPYVCNLPNEKILMFVRFASAKGVQSIIRLYKNIQKRTNIDSWLLTLNFRIRDLLTKPV